MQAYYNVLTNLRAKLELDEFVNTVTQGDIFDIDLTKQTIFPLAHIIVNDVTKVKNILQFNVTVMCMDIVDLSKDETTDVFLGNDNEQDVLNTQLAVGLRLVELLESGSGNYNFMMRGEPTFEAFTERFENNIAGWAVTFDIHVPNTMTSCDVLEPVPSVPSATAILKNSEGTTISTTTIASGGSATITAPDADISLNGEAFPSIPSGGSSDIKVYQSTGNTEIGSKQGQDFRIADSTAVVKNTAGTIIANESILSEESKDIILDDTSYIFTVDGVVQPTITLPTLEDTTINITWI